MSSIAMNMPRHIRTKPNQMEILAWVVLQTNVALSGTDFGMFADRMRSQGLDVDPRSGAVRQSTAKAWRDEIADRGDDVHRSDPSSWPGLSRPSMSWRFARSKDVNGRGKPGHDGARSLRQPRARALRAVEELQWVDWGRAFANLEVQLRRTDLAGLARLGDGLAALDGFAALDQEFAGVGIGGDVTVGVPHQHQIAVTHQLVPGISDDP